MRYLILFLLLLPLSYAQEVDNYNNRDSLNLRFTLESEIETISTGNPELDYLKTELLLIPEESSRQRIITKNINSDPLAEIDENGNIYLTWKEYSHSYKFKLDSEVQTQSEIYQITPQNFPITELPEEIEQYLEPTEFIDINQDILLKTNELIEGETELAEAVFKMADWTKENIDYDLNTITAKAVKKSSWVFENKEGVCDELTNLFISMLRSAGIPARFVTGMVYTNVDHDFGNHGWAEVYFPDQGWVPFDITFGQYGYLDPSHIKLMHGADSGTASAKYSWRSADIEMNPKELTLKTEVVSQGEIIESPFDFSIYPQEIQVGPESYVPIHVIIKNPFDSYVSTSLIITKAPELTSSNVKQVLLKPKQEKIVSWIAKIKPDLDPHLVYTSLLEVRDTFGNTANSEIEFASNYKTITENQAMQIISSLEEKDDRSYSKKLSLACNSDKSYYYNYEMAYIKCSVKNTGNTMVREILICYDSTCNQESLTIGQEKELSYSISLKEENLRQLEVTADNDDIHLSEIIPLQVYSKPDLRITFLEPPKDIDYSEVFTFKIALNSNVLVKNLNIRINDIDHYLDQSQETTILEATIKGSSLYKRPLNVKIDYKDENGNPFTLENVLEVNVINAPWYAKIFGVFRNLF